MGYVVARRADCGRLFYWSPTPQPLEVSLGHATSFGQWGMCRSDVLLQAEALKSSLCFATLFPAGITTASKVLGRRCSRSFHPGGKKIGGQVAASVPWTGSRSGVQTWKSGVISYCNTAGLSPPPAWCADSLAESLIQSKCHCCLSSGSKTEVRRQKVRLRFGAELVVTGVKAPWRGVVNNKSQKGDCVMENLD